LATQQSLVNKRITSQMMITRKSNAGRMFGQTVAEFSQPKWTGKRVDQSSVRDNESKVSSKNLPNNQVHYVGVTIHRTGQHRARTGPEMTDYFTSRTN